MTTVSGPAVAPAPSLLQRFMTYYAPHRRLFMLDFGCAVLAGLLELGFPVAIQSFIDRLLPTGQWGTILVASVALMAIYLLTAALKAVVTYWGHMLGINIETEMRRKAFSHVQKLSFRYFDNHKTGQLVGRLTKDLEEIGEVAHHGPEDLFIAVMTLVGALILMVNVQHVLALITAVLVPFVLWLTSTYGTRMTLTWQKIFRSVGDFNVRIEENVGGIRVVQAFANEDHERRLFAHENEKYRVAKLEGYRIMATSNTLSYLSMRITNLVVMVAGAYFVLHGQLSTGGFVGFLLLVNVFFHPIETINTVVEMYPKGVAGFQRYLELLDTEPDVQDRPGAVEAPALRGAVNFEDVGFGYADGRPVLQHINLKIEPGMTVAFVGPSGAGKTTLCALLPRFYDVTSGRITVDGYDIRDLTLTSLREQIGSVQQDVFLFGGSVRDNIAYGRLGASEADILEAARLARLDDVIAGLPDGLDTVVGERGVKLSGGQKQRLAIARMFLKNPPILILDEATSALDTATERAIQVSLGELAQGRTTLVIAHRLATVRNADLIVVVEGGRIVETGTHDGLLAQGGIYSSLHAAQLS